MLLKSCFVAVGVLIAGSFALFNDVETGSQPGKKNHRLYLGTSIWMESIAFLVDLENANKIRTQHL